MDTHRPRHGTNVVYRRLADGEAVLLHLGSGAYHELNAVGALLWELLDGRRDLPSLTAELAEVVEDPPPDLETVVASFVADLRQRDLAD